MRIIRGFVFTLGLAAMSGISTLQGAFAGSDAAVSEPEERGLLMPYINPARGRVLFGSKGCVVCHSVNGIGGVDAPALDGSQMPAVMNPFDFAARMWRGAGTMIQMQEDELGAQIEFNGNELVDIIAFVHDVEEQKKFTTDDIPPHIKDLMGHLVDESPAHEEKEHN